MKITQESVLVQMGHHRTPIEDIVKGLKILKSTNRLHIFFRKVKLCWIMISLLWKGVIDGDDGDYWINF